jgi:hypothetical protein
MYKLYSGCFIILLLIILLYILFSFKNILGISIALLYLIVISIIIVISFFTLRKKIYFVLIGISIILFLIGTLSSINIYSSYTVF